MSNTQNQIICPECNTAFSLDESHYALISQQVRTKEFNKELDIDFAYPTVRRFMNKEESKEVILNEKYADKKDLNVCLEDNVIYLLVFILYFQGTVIITVNVSL